MTPDLPGLCPEGHADGDFTAALGNGVAQDAVGSYRDEKQGYGRKNAAEQGRRATVEQTGGDAVVHGLNIIDDESGVQLPDSGLQIGLQSLRFEVSADSHEDVDVRTIGVGIIDRTLRGVIRETSLFYSADHSHHGECLGRIARLRALEEALAQRVSIGPVITGEILVHDASAGFAVGNPRR